jgi:hypothetical protein
MMFLFEIMLRKFKICIENDKNSPFLYINRGDLGMRLLRTPDSINIWATPYGVYGFKSACTEDFAARYRGLNYVFEKMEWVGKSTIEKVKL